MLIDDMLWVFVVGCVTGASGIGASLALPVLLALGMPAAIALLAFKLPLAVADLVAALCLARLGALPGVHLERHLALATLAAACGTWLVLAPAHALACVALGGLVWCGLRARRDTASLQVVALGVWIGACGIGAGLALVALGRRLCGDTLREAVGRARAIGAAANLAAVAVVAVCVSVPWYDVLGLTLALACGSGVGSTLIARLTGNWPGSAGLTMTRAHRWRIGPDVSGA